jgi:hypothetical protein
MERERETGMGMGIQDGADNDIQDSGDTVK